MESRTVCGNKKPMLSRSLRTKENSKFVWCHVPPPLMEASRKTVLRSGQSKGEDTHSTCPGEASGQVAEPVGWGSKLLEVSAEQEESVKGMLVTYMQYRTQTRKGQQHKWTRPVR